MTPHHQGEMRSIEGNMRRPGLLQVRVAERPCIKPQPEVIRAITLDDIPHVKHEQSTAFWSRWQNQRNGKLG